MHRIRGVVQNYAWGDESALPDLLGVEPDGHPWAEIWFGTHPSGSATALPMSGLDAEQPLDHVSGRLPFMLKLLAAAHPLSLQTHPSADQAARGFANEDSMGIPREATERIYVDPFAKPELLIALSTFRALCGVRPLEATDRLLRSIGGAAGRLADRLADGGLESVIGDYLVDRRPTFALVEACRRRREIPEAGLALELEKRHPTDPAVAISLLLNLVTLRRGEALYLTPGNLHAYIQGTGVEILGASDNVVRGGLTNKRTAVAELIEVFDPTPLPEPALRPRKVRDGVWRYDTPGAPFAVFAEHVTGSIALQAHSRQIVICAIGETDVLSTGEVVYLAPGDELELHGTATLFRVAEI